ncbi:glucose PTS transporter subunit IIA [Clostridium pasteurianum]|uniref:PTS beta-glucoside transporter subunit IIBCA n=1 Tax=Clostridium pasteurianum TaxID=1501 RepID=UPI0022608779|nr:PTS transporter subunit IIBCA [Clostridium pasteurianum]UZW14878.1 glucose PTS transporter subunit IIA [Clostridium pasteurianum]
MNNKDEKYLNISKEIVEYVGGVENIQGVAHCATRLRIVLEDKSKVKTEKIEDVELVKGVFTVGDQLQIIFGAGLVNEVYSVFSKYTGTENMSLADVKSKSAEKQNPLQKAIKSLSDIFIEIMPGILAAALLMGLTGVLGQKGLFGPKSVVQMVPALAGINRLVGIASSSIFSILPLIVAYSATKRYGGKPVLGLVLGAIMLNGNLADAFAAANGSVKPEIINILGLNIELVGFQGGIIIALMIGYVVAALDKFFDRKIPNAFKLLVSPMLTVLISAILLFTIIGPVGRGLANGITFSLLWMTQHLGFIGYMIFAGVQQIIVITGLHHIMGAVEAQLLSSTGNDFLNPLMSVALFGQGGAVLGFLLLNRKNTKTKEVCIASFGSVLFGISEPAIFGVTLKNKFPLIAGCCGGAIAGAYVYFSKLTAIGFGTTAVPGIAIASPANNGYINYIIAHLIALVAAGSFTFIYGKAKNKELVDNKDFLIPVSGEVMDLEEVNDGVFSTKMMGDGFAIEPENGTVLAPFNGIITSLFPTKHALSIMSDLGVEILVHFGLETVNLNGEGFTAHVKEGDRVKAGDKLLTVDIDKIKDKVPATTVMVIFTELNGKSFSYKKGKADTKDKNVIAIE